MYSYFFFGFLFCLQFNNRLITRWLIRVSGEQRNSQIKGYKFRMAAFFFGNRKFIRRWPILIILCVALLLIWRNLHQAQKIAEIGGHNSVESLTNDSCQKRFLENEEPNKITLRKDSPRTRELRELLKCRNRQLRFQKLQHGEYWLLQNLVIGRKSRLVGCAESVTYTTNGDYTFFDNLETVATR